jgi:bifunctional DNA-binding transcriptional regulator/antitoxin component of YhaV-PrlF toxin-antitoxin module
MEEELVKMSEKGQLVVPRRIREKEGFKNSDRFVAIDVKGGVIFKKVDIPKITTEFEALAREVEARFKKQKIKKKDVEKAVRWAREK